MKLCYDNTPGAITTSAASSVRHMGCSLYLPHHAGRVKMKEKCRKIDENQEEFISLCFRPQVSSCDDDVVVVRQNKHHISWREWQPGKNKKREWRRGVGNVSDWRSALQMTSFCAAKTSSQNWTDMCLWFSIRASAWRKLALCRNMLNISVPKTFTNSLVFHDEIKMITK